MGIRGLVLVLVALLAASACSSSKSKVTPEATSGRYGSGVDLDALDGRKTAAPKAAPAGSVNNQPANNQPAPTSESAGGPDVRTDFDKAADLGGTGRNAAVYLRGTRYTKLVLEINAAKGWGPDPQALNILRARIGGVLDKRDGIEIPPVRTFESTKTTYTMSDIAALENRYRTRFSGKTGGTAVIHMLYLNGSASGFVGRAYHASSVVIMAQAASQGATALVSRAQIEGAVLVHEVGHLLRMVNNGYQSPRDHHDAEHPGHSKNKASVMYWAVEGGSVIADVFDGPPPNAFDADDLADLADLKSGRLGPK
ncbi:MAG: hypothetical protein WD646_03915 [Actinomycetota bacterium]